MSAGWCKTGAIAKTAEGALGVVAKVYADGNVRLLLAGGALTDRIKADTLVQAQATDAGYDALAPIAQGVELAAAAWNGRPEDVGGCSLRAQV